MISRTIAVPTATATMKPNGLVPAMNPREMKSSMSFEIKKPMVSIMLFTSPKNNSSKITKGAFILSLFNQSALCGYVPANSFFIPDCINVSEFYSLLEHRAVGHKRLKFPSLSTNMNAILFIQ